ncbi:hypothetical protein J1614_012266 [Plenodomus biglobosus]|nr:hypothetical protein J1614_012266 [Plenodomus biglobosus]
MADATPVRPLHGTQSATTRPDDPQSPGHRNLRASRRTQPGLDQTAIPLSFVEGATRPSVAEAVNQQMQAALQATQTRHSIIATLAQAIDNCMTGFTTPTECLIAQELQQRVIQALTTSIEYSQAEPEVPDRGGPRPNRATASQSRLAPHTDYRILITIPQDSRLRQPAPIAIRQAICKAVEGVALEDIPKATRTNTGWAITPANNEVRALLMDQVNKELMMRALEADDARLPVRWVNYALQGVASSYRNIQGIEIPPTTELVAAEAYSQTRHHPVSCRPSKHGVQPNGTYNPAPQPRVPGLLRSIKVQPPPPPPPPAATTIAMAHFNPPTKAAPRPPRGRGTALFASLGASLR